MTHPYYASKAREVLVSAGGDPDTAGPLAEWAQANHHEGAPTGVIVARDGSIVADVVTCYPSGMDGHPVTWVADADFRRLGLQYQALDAALAELRARGQEVIYIKRWQVTRGAAQHTAGSPLAAVAAATREKRTTTDAAATADAAWREAIRSAIDAGHSLGQVAHVAEVTRGRVQQIRDGHR